MDCCRQTRRAIDPVPDNQGTEMPDRMRQAPLLFTLKEACPARLCVEDLRDPQGFQRRLEEWLLRQ